MREASSRLFSYFSLAVLTSTTCAMLVWSMPASVADVLLSNASQGAIRLAQPRGRFLEGSGQMQLFAHRLDSEFSQLIDVAPSGMEVSPVVLINRLSWKISWVWTFSGPHAYLSLSSRQFGGSFAKMPIRFSLNGLYLPAGSFKLSRIDLAGVPGPVGIVRPTFDMELTWPDTTINFKNRTLLSDADWLLELSDVSTALSPLRSLGSYRLTLNALERTWVLESVGSPVLLLSGQGHFAGRPEAFIGMKCTRSCEFVSSLMATLGKRNGEVYEIRIGSGV